MSGTLPLVKLSSQQNHHGRFKSGALVHRNFNGMLHQDI